MKVPKLIDIRVIAPAEHAQNVGELVALLVASTPNKTFKLIEQSKPYPCRPPKDDHSRVYLKFEVREQ